MKLKTLTSFATRATIAAMLAAQTAIFRVAQEMPRAIADPMAVRPNKAPRLVSAGGVAFSDLSGNLKLKNINDVAGSTISPSTSSSTYVVISEMTITFTTKGNRVYLVFTGSFNTTTTGSNLNANVAIFRDGTQISPDYLLTWTQTGSQLFCYIAGLSLIDAPSAASHTYDIRYRAGVNTPTVVAFGTARRLQVVELG